MRRDSNTSPVTTFSLVREYPAADPASARQHFLMKLSVETDVADLVTDVARGTGNLLVIDVRASDAYEQCHIPGAINIPHRQINAESTSHLPKDSLLITYCWGPACNSATKAAEKLAALGFQVKELAGGIEYWRHEGCPVEGSLAEKAPLYWSSASG